MSHQTPNEAERPLPTFSVLVASYNQAEYVLDTLDTVAGQTCTDYELVIVDDGSTDDTAAKVSSWIEGFRRTHPNRVQLVTIENSGQSAAFEHGFGMCRGRYVALLDSDDRWLADKLERVTEAVRDDPEAGMLIHPLYVIDADGRRTGDIRPLRAKLSDGDIRQQVRETSRHVAPATSGVVIRADVFGQLVPMPTRRFRTAADLYLTLGAALIAPVRAVQEPLAEYRMHPNGQHIRTMLSPEGVRYWVELQSTIARHLGLEGAVERNSYFVRHVFALAKLDGSIPQQIRAFAQLARATCLDTTFEIPEKLLFLLYWTACLFTPRAAFRRLWRAFQMKQTGFDKLQRQTVLAVNTLPGSI